MVGGVRFQRDSVFQDFIGSVTAAETRTRETPDADPRGLRTRAEWSGRIGERVRGGTAVTLTVARSRAVKSSPRGRARVASVLHAIVVYIDVTSTPLTAFDQFTRAPGSRETDTFTCTLRALERGLSFSHVSARHVRTSTPRRERHARRGPRRDDHSSRLIAIAWPANQPPSRPAYEPTLRAREREREREKSRCF